VVMLIFKIFISIMTEWLVAKAGTIITFTAKTWAFFLSRISNLNPYINTVNFLKALETFS
jgi:hypothetical protein